MNTTFTRNLKRNENDNNHSLLYIVNFETLAKTESCKENLFVDCETTAHIIDKLKFINFKNSFKYQTHTFELADGRRIKCVVLCKGETSILLNDMKNKVHKLMLKDALYVPSYN